MILNNREQETQLRATTPRNYDIMLHVHGNNEKERVQELRVES